MTGRHYEVRNSLAFMRTQAFSSYSNLDKPIISSIWYGSGPAAPSRIQPDNIKSHPKLDHAAGLRGGIQIHHTRQRQTDTIIDVIVTETDTKSYIPHSIDNVT